MFFQTAHGVPRCPQMSPDTDTFHHPQAPQVLQAPGNLLWIPVFAIELRSAQAVHLADEVIQVQGHSVPAA